MIKKLMHLLWKSIPRASHWWLLWFANAKFNVGIVGVIVNEQGEVLLLRHVYRRTIVWELPSGWMKRGEMVEEAIRREVLEETGLSMFDPVIVKVKSGYQLRIEFVVAGSALRGATPSCGHEILEARFFSRDSLPKDLKSEHLDYVTTFSKSPISKD